MQLAQTRVRAQSEACCGARSALKRQANRNVRARPAQAPASSGIHILETGPRPAPPSHAARRAMHTMASANSHGSTEERKGALIHDKALVHVEPGTTPVPSPAMALMRTVAKACALVLVVVLCQHVLVPAAHAAAAAAASSGTGGGNFLAGALDFVLHLDHHMSAMIEQHGRTTYAILFAIVFAETGLVLTPFLPGDSLLFAAGAFAGMGKLDIGTLMAVFITSAILGDAVNYAVGNKLGGWAVKSNLVKQEYIQKTEKFYAKYGGKTVVLARFVPIIRTFAPFVAGVGSMPYSAFATYNVFGAVLWAVLFVGGGFFFGNLPFVQKNFTLVVLAIVAVSVVPVIIELINARKEDEEERKRSGGGKGTAT